MEHHYAVITLYQNSNYVSFNAPDYSEVKSFNNTSQFMVYAIVPMFLVYLNDAVHH